MMFCPFLWVYPYAIHICTTQAEQNKTIHEWNLFQWDCGARDAIGTGDAHKDAETGWQMWCHLIGMMAASRHLISDQ